MMADELEPGDIDSRLNTSFVGRHIIYHQRIESTMDLARLEVRMGAPEGTVIIAGEQTRGRGRMQRTWFSPGGNIALSIILYPTAPALPQLIMVTSLAVVGAIGKVTGLEALIKWPNDVLVDGKKVCGILIENELKDDKVVYASIGIGINLSIPPGELEGLLYPATSLEEAYGQKLARVEIIATLLNEFEKLYLSPPDEVFAAWRENLATIGQRIRVTSGRQILRGVAEDVDISGALVIRQDDGTLTKIISGDVSLRNDD